MKFFKFVDKMQIDKCFCIKCKGVYKSEQLLILIISICLKGVKPLIRDGIRSVKLKNKVAGSSPGFAHG